MLKSCQYCGRIHDTKKDCGKKPKRKKETSHIDRFRWTAKWQKKREEIRERDGHVCQVCVRDMHGTTRKYTHEDVGVHHADPMSSDWGKRLDNNNLLTLCNRHHEMAETGEISRGTIKGIIAEQEQIVPPQGGGVIL